VPVSPAVLFHHEQHVVVLRWVPSCLKRSIHSSFCRLGMAEGENVRDARRPPCRMRSCEPPAVPSLLDRSAEHQTGSSPRSRQRLASPWPACGALLCQHGTSLPSSCACAPRDITCIGILYASGPGRWERDTGRHARDLEPRGFPRVHASSGHRLAVAIRRWW